MIGRRKPLWASAAKHPAGVEAVSIRNDRPGCAGVPAASAGLAPQKSREPPPQPATAGGLLALLAVLEPANSAGIGVPVKQPSPVRIMWTTRFRSVGVAVRHKSLTESLTRRVADGGGTRPFGGLVHRAGAASRATAAAGWGVDAPGARRRSTRLSHIPSRLSHIPT
jgi:hypothetical protein